MATKVLILGDSGTGKSASLRNFKPEEVLVINAAGKPLPFRNHFETVTPAFSKMTSDVIKAMDSTSKKVIIIDDAQYIMSFQYMRRIKENGWDKWNDIQGDFFNIVQHIDDLPADTIVYILSHIQRDEEGREKLKTMGKMLDEKITLEGLFTVVLKTSVADGQYCFLTQNSGKDTVKSPIGMFDSYAIDNDLKYVDTKIRNYYEIGDFVDDAQVAQLDQAVAKTEIVKEAAGDRRRRRKASDNPETIEQQRSGNVDGQGTVSTSSPSTEGSTGKETEVADDKLQEIKDLTDQRVKAMEGIEALKTERRRRTRRDINEQNKEEVNKEASVEEKKEEAAAEPAAEATAVNNVRTDAPRRRRRQRTPEVADDKSVAQLVEESGIAQNFELPFEV